jgi:hypothetical protein
MEKKGMQCFLSINIFAYLNYVYNNLTALITNHTARGADSCHLLLIRVCPVGCTTATIVLARRRQRLNAAKTFSAPVGELALWTAQVLRWLVVILLIINCLLWQTTR